MLPTTIRTPPAIEDFVPLAEYQSQTPESFVGGKPVLYYHTVGAKAWIPKSQGGTLPIFPADSSSAPSGPEGNQINGDAEELIEQKVDIFVNSNNFTIFSPQVESGVSIPYPSISIHAVKQIGTQSEGRSTQAVWMQLEFADGGAGDDDFNTVELTIIPPSNESDAESNPAKQLYEAMASCSDLHPDPNDGDEDEEEEYADRIVFEGSTEHEAIEGFTGVLRGTTDGGLPPPMPGSGGWITADNVNEYFDKDGNWIGQGGEDEELGEGAGRVRARDEVEANDSQEEDANDDPENKRARVD